MNQPTNGQKNLEEQLDVILDEYEKGHNLNFPAFSHDMSFYWNMSRDYIEALSREEREEIAIQLTQQAMYIQRLFNRERARVSFCDASIHNVCAKEWDNYNHVFKHDMRVAVISRENKVVEKLLKIKNHAKVRMDSLDGVTSIIRHLSDLLIRSAYGKEPAKRYHQDD